MIYRFRSALTPYKVVPGSWGVTTKPATKLKNKLWHHPRMGGAWSCGTLGMSGLPAPSNVHPRARFYFTEKGFRRFGKEIIADAKANGQVLRVEKRKNPEKSEIVWQDEWQVAILPRKTTAIASKRGGGKISV